MPHPIPLPLRQVIQRRVQQGHSPAAIAEALGLATRTVRHLVQRLRLQGADALAASYVSPLDPRSLQLRELQDEALDLRRQHPTWGAGFIRVRLRRSHPQHPLPAERTIQRWFERTGLAPAPRGRRPGVNPRRATQPHEVWQMDAAERVALVDKAQVSWLRLVDECSGAVLHTAVFPPRLLEQRPGQRCPNSAAAGLSPLGTAVAPACG